MKKIIALTGVKFSGKTTAFNIIKEEIPNVIEIQLAKKLKDECAKAFKIDRKLFDDPRLKEEALETPIYLDPDNLKEVIESYGKRADYDKYVRKHVGTVLDSPRKVAQYIGTEVLRAVAPDIHCFGAILNLPESGLFVVTDMRFPNEYEFFKQTYPEAFYPFYIQNNQAESRGAADPHPSERYVAEVAKNCKPINNNGSLADLRAEVKRVLGGIND